MEDSVFNEDFLKGLPSDPEKAAYAMCERFQEVDVEISPEHEIENYDSYVEAFAALEAYLELVGISFPSPAFTTDRASNIKAIRDFFNTLFNQLDRKMVNLALASSRDKFRTKFGTVFLYEFSDGDLKRIQVLINELRDLIVASELFDANHKERILKKLEVLQRELHKKISSVDKLWGLIGEGGVALGKFGKDAKPFVDRISEIAQITWRTQARAEELPSGTTLPLLTRRKTEEDK